MISEYCDGESESIHHNEPKPQPLHVALIGALSVVIAVILLVVIGSLYGCTGGVIPFEYGIVIDAGSTHTEVFLYQWLGNKYHGTGVVSQKDYCTVPGGVTVIPDPAVILSCVTNVTDSIPAMLVPTTPLYLAATGGMRLLRLTDPKQANLILLVLHYALQQTKLDVKLVDIIEGFQEGTTAWITTNYLSKTFSGKHFSWPLITSNNHWYTTYAALDMGGASTQIAFAVDTSEENNYTHTTLLRLYGLDYNVMSESFLCFGLVEAFRRHQAVLIRDLDSTENVLDPCLPKGNFSKSVASTLLGSPCTLIPTFETWLETENHKHKEFIFEGTSDFRGCKKSVEDLFNSSSCAALGFKHCAEKFDTSDAPNQFLAFSGYYYITHFLNSTNVSLEEFVNNIEKWCDMSWDEIKHHTYRKSDHHHLTEYCFGSLYILQWLIDIYSFDENSWGNITFQQEIDGIDIGWSLGFMINATNLIAEELPSMPVISTTVFSCLVVCSVFITIIGTLLLYRYFKPKCVYSKLQHERLFDS